MSLVVELFPVLQRPPMWLYRPSWQADEPDNLYRFAYALSQHLGETWFVYRDMLACDVSHSDDRIEGIINQLRRLDLPALLQTLTPVDDEAATPYLQAQHALVTGVRQYEYEIYRSMASLGIFIDNGYVERIPGFYARTVQGEPALAFDVRSMLKLNRNLHEYLREVEDNESIIGLQVMDKTAPTLIGHITRTVGTLANQRRRLSVLSQRDIMQRIIERAEGNEQVVTVDTETYQYDYTASALHIIVNSNDPAMLQRFSISGERAQDAFRLAPYQRAIAIRKMAEVLKKAGIIDDAYNSVQHEDFFDVPHGYPTVVFGDGQRQPFSPRNYGFQIRQYGLYGRSQVSALAAKADTDQTTAISSDTNTADAAVTSQRTVRLSLIDASHTRSDDFIEALQQEARDSYGVAIEVVRRRSIRVLSSDNIDASLRTVQKDDPEVVLALFPLSPPDNPRQSLWHFSRYAGDEAVARGINMLIVPEHEYGDPTRLLNALVGLLMRCGITPAGLVDLPESVDLLGGLTVYRVELSREQRLYGVLTLMHADGHVVGAATAMVSLDDETSVVRLITSLFDQMADEGGVALTSQRLLLHVSNYLSFAAWQALQQLAASRDLQLHTIVLKSRAITRIHEYERSIEAPDWGTTFWLDSNRMLTITTRPSRSTTPRPLEIYPYGVFHDVDDTGEDSGEETDETTRTDDAGDTRSQPASVPQQTDIDTDDADFSAEASALNSDTPADLDRTVMRDSVLAPSLLHYRGITPAKMPVTLYNHLTIIDGLQRGLLEPAFHRYPFWL